MALRKSEASAIRWSDVDLPGGTLTVRAEIDKAGQRWVLPLTDEARDLLASEARRPHGAHDLIFRFKDPRATFDLTRKALGLPHITPHHLRHFRISEWANSTRRIGAVQFLARHLSLATTAKYVRSRTEAAAEALAEMSAAKNSTTQGRRNSTTVPIDKHRKR
jgi:integrase